MINMSDWIQHVLDGRIDVHLRAYVEGGYHLAMSLGMLSNIGAQTEGYAFENISARGFQMLEKVFIHPEPASVAHVVGACVEDDISGTDYDQEFVWLGGGRRAWIKRR